MPLALLALAIGAFGIGTTEFVIAGLLPEVARDFGVSIPTAGYLISGYALGVAAGAAPMTVLGTRMRRKHLLLALMVIFILGNVLSALAPTYGLMMTGRIVASFTHGAFFGVGAILAGDLVAPGRRASAIALMFTGLTLANVLGVPMGTFIGQAFGWRVTFWVVAGLGVVGLLGIAALVPAQPRPTGTDIGAELAVFRNPQVWLAIAMTVLGFGGVFASFTYIAPMMTEVAGFSEGAVSWLLVLFGIGLVIGNLLGGRLADRALMPSLYALLAGLALVLAVFTFTSRAQIPAAITVFLLGAFGFATVPPLQKRVLDNAAAAPTLASAVNIGAFNLGNALAAWLGGLVITAGLGYTAPNWVGALLAAAALALAALSGLLERRTVTAAAPRSEMQPV
ncbi:MFS transporter, DHA1 family, inner membrane transport protein [Streptosporangium canum]|uniref:MFS transporter, DHA1 family, inner membrane transport protein n=1 Tax=Streptosporangium canum TaxID=324952 RepID=A0A1I4B1K1_9ACTN|nr:MFS transporter [Streptosporangium canum]SFK62655.1 MFS transporter, DHA1 family, inner membrane transport protein [Streptosporangium canum]